MARTSMSCTGVASEEWRPVVGYETYYEVSNLGRVRSFKRMAPLIGSFNCDGYRTVTLWTPHGQATKRVHRLVCEAFHGPPNLLHRETAHLDGSRTNNSAANLKWVSHAENVAHKRLHGTHGAGERHPRAKLTEDMVRHAIGLMEKGEASAEIAERFGVSHGAIESIRRGKNWRHIPRPELRRPTLCGADNHSAVLTWREASEIRRRRLDGETAAALRSEYGISKSAIYKLLAGETYQRHSAHNR